MSPGKPKRITSSPALRTGAPPQPSYAVVGLMARYEMDKHWSMSVNLNNLFDKTYMPGLGSYGTGVYGDPRNVPVTACCRIQEPPTPPLIRRSLCRTSVLSVASRLVPTANLGSAGSYQPPQGQGVQRSVMASSLGERL